MKIERVYTGGSKRLYTLSQYREYYYHSRSGAWYSIVYVRGYVIRKIQNDYFTKKLNEAWLSGKFREDEDLHVGQQYVDDNLEKQIAANL